MIDIEKDGSVKSVNHYNLIDLVKFTDDFGNTTYQAVVDGYDNAIELTESEYQAFLNADYSQGGGGQGGGLTPQQKAKLDKAITSDTISTMEFDGDKTLTINGTPFEGGGGSSMVYNTTTHVMSGAKDQDGNDYNFEVGTITITI